MDVPMTQRPVAIALVGAGAIAQSYVAALEHCTLARAVAVADSRIDQARDVAHRLALPAFAGHAELLANVACDAVIVCTPPAGHMEIAIDALRAGAHVLCEKPLT